MGHRRSGTIESRFAEYVEGLVSVIGHADSCATAAGLLRRPDDAVWSARRGAFGGQVTRRRGWRRSTSRFLHFVARDIGRTRAVFWPRYARWCAGDRAAGPIEAWIIG